MGNKITTLSISELLELNFYVPAYQRGYRWTEQQVNDLMDDIYSFATKPNKSSKEFYCLQPVIVKERSEKHNGKAVYEVIDGQQRLTTIRIIFSYLIKEKLLGRSFKERYGKELFSIFYETRPDCTDFLDNIKLEDKSNIDYYHISSAYKYISNWITKKVIIENKMLEDVLDTIIRTLVFDQNTKKEEGVLQVIWYEITDKITNPIDVFIRINVGKISLTNAELIKALFLQERNFGNGDLAKLKQLEIAQDWDRIENSLQEENFWWFLNKEENNASSHIEFIFDMIKATALKMNPELEEIIGDDQYQTFRFFNHKMGANPDDTAIKKLWDEVNNYYNTFQEWYDNPIWYHYIGFLIYSGYNIEIIFELLNQDIVKTKNKATKLLVEKIKQNFKSISWYKLEEDNNLDSEYHLNISYHSKKELLRSFYLMFNLEYIIEKSSQKNLIYKFPFKSFKIGNNNKAWDIEHVNSGTENRLEDFKEKKEWFENALLDIPSLDKELKAKIKEFLQKEKDDEDVNELFDTLYIDVLKETGELEIGRTLKDSIGNLTLLDAGTNRGYGNALFSTKRRKIIEKDKKGVFIPICTKNVFFKYFNGNMQNKWTEADIIGYQRELERVMSKFIEDNRNEKI